MAIVIPLIHSALWIMASYKWGNWKGWRRYYPTILFFALGNMIYVAVFHDKLLWFYNSPVGNTLIDIYYSITIFPCVILLFIPYFPKYRYKQILYFCMWIFIFSILEMIYKQTGLIIYSNGWNIWWSIFHNVYQFPLLILHYKKPLLAWIISFIILGIIMYIFKPPIHIRT